MTKDDQSHARKACLDLAIEVMRAAPNRFALISQAKEENPSAVVTTLAQGILDWVGPEAFIGQPSTGRSSS